jgi:hypothetical protein
MSIREKTNYLLFMIHCFQVSMLLCINYEQYCLMCFLSASQHYDKVFLLHFCKCDRNLAWRFCIKVCSKFLADYYIPICTNLLELMKSVDSHDSSSLLFMMKMMV